MRGDALGKFNAAAIARKRSLIAPNAMPVSVFHLHGDAMALIAQIVDLKIHVQGGSPAILPRRVGHYHMPVFAKHLEGFARASWVEPRRQVQIAHAHRARIVSGHLEGEHGQPRPVGLHIAEGQFPAIPALGQAHLHHIVHHAVGIDRGGYGLGGEPAFRLHLPHDLAFCI